MKIIKTLSKSWTDLSSLFDSSIDRYRISAKAGAEMSPEFIENSEAYKKEIEKNLREIEEKKIKYQITITIIKTLFDFYKSQLNLSYQIKETYTEYITSYELMIQQTKYSISIVDDSRIFISKVRKEIDYNKYRSTQEEIRCEIYEGNNMSLKKAIYSLSMIFGYHFPYQANEIDTTTDTFLEVYQKQIKEVEK